MIHVDMQPTSPPIHPPRALMAPAPNPTADMAAPGEHACEVAVPLSKAPLTGPPLSVVCGNEGVGPQRQNWRESHASGPVPC